MKASNTGNTFDVQRFSIHDGPGIRTTVFLKGCPLRCEWCHNPEGISPDNNLFFQPDRCLGCGYCFGVCPNKAHQMIDGEHVLDRDSCSVCGICANECWPKAIEIVGRNVSVEDVIDEVLRDKPFYETSGGGMTLSGGEPMMQIDFTEALLIQAKAKDVHCCVETCGFTDPSGFERIIPYVDLFLYDIKDMDDDKHQEFTGASNKQVLSNLKMLHDRGVPIVLRFPVLTGYNDREDHFAASAALIRGLPGLVDVEVMPGNPLGLSKYERMGCPAPCFSETPSEAMIAVWRQRLTGR